MYVKYIISYHKHGFQWMCPGRNATEHDHTMKEHWFSPESNKHPQLKVLFRIIALSDNDSG